MSKQENKSSLAEAKEKLQKLIGDGIIVQMAYSYYKAKENVRDGVKDFREYCESSAKQFGINIEDSASKFDESRKSIKDIQDLN